MGGENVAYTSVPEKEKYEDPPLELSPPLKKFGARHVQVLLLFVSLTVGYTMRAQLSLSMVAMVKANAGNEVNSSCLITRNVSNLNNDLNILVTGNGNVRVNNSLCKLNQEEENKGAKISKWSPYRTYDWDKATQEMILFSFFVGYTAMMIPMGIIAQKFGGKKPILVALGVNGVVSILTPWVPVFAGWLGVCTCRLLQGMTQAALYPSIQTMLGKWAPFSERGRLSTYAYTGAQFGTVFIFQIAGMFAGSPSLGWPAIFWFCGVLSLCCCGLFAWLGSATPNDCSHITTEEMIYIIGDGSADVKTKKRKTPWKHILTSLPVWGLVISHLGSTFGYLLVLTEIPTYMNRVLGVDIKRNGIYSSLPYIAMYLTALAFGALADFLANRKIMSTVNIRRMANTIGIMLSGVFLVAFGYISSTVIAIILLVCCLGTHSGVFVGFHINHIDLAPNFAGPIMALGNMLANLFCLLVPVLVSYVIQDDVTNHKRWQTVFIIVGALQSFTNLIFVIFVKTNVQPWNFYGDEQEHDAEKLPNKNKIALQDIQEKNGDIKMYNK